MRSVKGAGPRFSKSPLLNLTKTIDEMNQGRTNLKLWIICSLALSSCGWLQSTAIKTNELFKSFKIKVEESAVVRRPDPLHRLVRPIDSYPASKDTVQARKAVEEVNATYYFL